MPSEFSSCIFNDGQAFNNGGWVSSRLARRENEDVAPDKVISAKNMAFAFDIDGVLIHGDRLIPEGKRVLEILNGDNELVIKVSSNACFTFRSII
jgi:hypothetical protein